MRDFSVYGRFVVYALVWVAVTACLAPAVQPPGVCAPTQFPFRPSDALPVGSIAAGLLMIAWGLLRSVSRDRSSGIYRCGIGIGLLAWPMLPIYFGFLLHKTPPVIVSLSLMAACRPTDPDLLSPLLYAGALYHLVMAGETLLRLDSGSVARRQGWLFYHLIYTGILGGLPTVLASTH